MLHHHLAAVARKKASSGDGKYLYVGEYDGDILKYDMTDIDDLSTASYAEKTSASSSGLTGVYVDPTGTKVSTAWDTGSSSSNRQRTYTMSAHNLSTLSFSTSWSIVSEQNLRGIFYGDNGNKVFMCGDDRDRVSSWATGSAYGLFTGSQSFFDTSSQVISHSSLCFNTSGTKMYVGDDSSTSGDIIYQYTLSSAWDITTTSYDSKTLAATNPTGLWINANGTKLFVINGDTSVITRYTLSTPYDVSTGSADANTLNLSSNTASTPYGLCFVG